MKTTLATCLTYLFAVACSSNIFAAGPGKHNDFGGKRVLIVGVSGLRPDALQAANTPHIDALIAKGVITHNAYAGGNLAATKQPTLSGPGWCSVLTGVWSDRHRVVDDDFAGYDKFVSKESPDLFRRIKTAVPNSYVASITSWAALEDAFISKLGTTMDFHRSGLGVTPADRDLDVKNRALTQLGSIDPDVLFLQFSQAEEIGHASGYTPGNSSYLKAIESIDACIGEVMAATKKRPKSAEEKWLIILTSDHGGTAGGARGGQSMEERTTSMLVSGDIVNAPHVSTESPGLTAVPPTVMKYLGIPVKGEWQWSSPAFGFPPYLVSVAGKGNVTLKWKLPLGGLPNLNGFELYRDEKPIAKLAANIITYTDTPGAGDHKYELRCLGTDETRTSIATVTGDLNEQLVLHLPFDGNVQDSSGRKNHGTLSGAPRYVGGHRGQCLEFTDMVSPHQFVDLGQSRDLQFGAIDSFTASVWVNHNGDFTDNRASGGSINDAAILSNKDWGNGKYPGWVIAAGNNGRWQWNIADGKNRADYDGPASQLTDGKWHHLCVVHNRTKNEARMFYDGVMVAARSLSEIGDVNTGKATAVATDGNFGKTWANWFDGKIDEVKIWRRALQDSEVKELFKQ